MIFGKHVTMQDGGCYRKTQRSTKEMQWVESVNDMREEDTPWRVVQHWLRAGWGGGVSPTAFGTSDSGVLDVL